MERKNYNNQLKKLKTQKFDELYQKKPFLTLPKAERLWWIRYYKLKVAAQKAGWTEKFPKLREGPIYDRPWFKHDHWINIELNVIQKFVEKKLVNWEKLQDYTVPMVFCDGDCEGCNHIRICILKEREGL